MRGKKASLLLVITLVAAVLTSRSTVALEMTKLYVSPITVTGVAVDDYFSINVTVANVEKLFGYQFLLRYNTSILTATEYTNLANLAYSPLNTAAACGINDTEGWVSVAYSCPPAERTGLTTVDPKPLTQITFKVDANGRSTLEFDEEGTVLADIYGNSIRYPWYLLTSDGIFSNIGGIELHDIAVTDVSVNATTAKPGDVIGISITVKNNGNFDETFPVSAKYNRSATMFTEIGTKTVPSLAPGNQTTLTFNWITAVTLPEGKYFVRATATVTDENNPIDNIRDSNMITVKKEAGTLFNIFNIAIAGVVIIIVAAAVYMMWARRRRKK